jgi:hypothetical protein
VVVVVAVAVAVVVALAVVVVGQIGSSAAETIRAYLPVRL